MFYLNSKDWKFEEIGIPGVTMAHIWGEDGTGADLIRFEKGATFPVHDHEGPEQIVMLSGKIRFGDIVMAPGDYMNAGPGFEHDAEALEDSVFFLDHVGGAIIKN
ncbi:cupin domain-containing protein [Sphingopyxis fribergensis]